ncbi:hypothetical protein WD019_04860 [Fictibacillus sp. Mic-4]|uniref:hypothetical protein n=1 Tax=Fictibacillus TaxID=1329200 RepID=UPI00041266EC|nr:hypothetical protein [Fictibacillus gelatini]
MGKQHDQADLLRSKMSENKVAGESKLPSRKEYHSQLRKKRRKKLDQSESGEKKQKMPLSRILLFCFLVLVLLTLTYQYWSPHLLNPAGGNNDTEIEEVNIEPD